MKPVREEEDFVEPDEDYSEEYGEEYASAGYEVPLFDGEARLAARVRLPARRFDVWAEVSAACGSGALLSAAGARDHVWLGFAAGRAELRLDAGSGPLVLRAGRVRADSRQRLWARRYKRDAVLQLGSAAASGSARGSMTSLDVHPYIHVGQPPTNITRLAGASKIPGFIGCVHRLRVGGRDIIPPAPGLSFTSQGVRACTPHNLAQLVCP